MAGGEGPPGPPGGRCCCRCQGVSLLLVTATTTTAPDGPALLRHAVAQGALDDLSRFWPLVPLVVLGALWHLVSQLCRAWRLARSGISEIDRMGGTLRSSCTACSTALATT